MGTALTLDRYAAMRAEMEAGSLRDEVLARAGLTPDEWTEAQRAWLERMGEELERGRFELTNRYTQVFFEQQRAIAEEQQRALLRVQQRAIAEEQQRAIAEEQQRALLEEQQRALLRVQQRAIAEEQQRAAIAASTPVDAPSVPSPIEAATPWSPAPPPSEPTQPRSTQPRSTPALAGTSPLPDLATLVPPLPFARRPARRRAPSAPMAPESADPPPERPALQRSTPGLTGTSPLRELTAIVAALPFASSALPAPTPAQAAPPPAPPAPAADEPPPALPAPASQHAPPGLMGTSPLPNMAAIVAALPFGQAPAPSRAPEPAPAHATPPAATSAPRGAPPLSLEHYAALCVELSLAPRRAAEIYPRYGLRDPAAWQATDAAWQARMRDDDALQARWQQLVAHYRAYYRAQ